MNTEKMYYFDKFCCICMNKSDLKHLFEVDSDGVSHYNKLTSSIAEMNFKEMNDQRLICAECCITLHTVYDFRQMCLRSKTNLITHISQLQTYNNTSCTVRVCLKDIKPEAIVEKNRGGSDKEDSNCFEGSNPQIELQTECYKQSIRFSGSVKQECESGDDDSSANEDATVGHMNDITHIEVKVEDVENGTKMEDYLEYTQFNKIEIEENPLAVVKEEPMSDSEAPQDGSTSEKLKGSKATTIGTELAQNTEKNNQRLFQCQICQTKGFKGMDSLLNHMRAHAVKSSNECEICKKSFQYKKILNRHMKTHSGNRPYECGICKKEFYNNWNLSEHMKTHSSKRAYGCQLCKKSFKHKSSLTVHMETHSDERAYKCLICKKCFQHKRYLTVHMRTHASKRPYECKICKKGFNQKNNLTTHINRHSSKRHLKTHSDDTS